MVDGAIGLGDRFESAATGEAFEVLELGLLAPEPLPLLPPLRLGAGQARAPRWARAGADYSKACGLPAQARRARMMGGAHVSVKGRRLRSAARSSAPASVI